MALMTEVRRIAPELAAADEEANQLRRLPDHSWKQLMECGVLRSLQPARFGGGEVSLLEFIDAVVELSKAAPSAGWVAGVIGVHPWQLALFPDEAQQEMWAEDPERMHSSSYNPTGKAQRVDGGYKVWGRWWFSSGCDHCRGVNLGAIVRSGERSAIPEYRSFLLYPDQYRIEDNWFVAGLKGTGSKDIVVEEAFVPQHRSQSHVDYALGRPLPGQQVNPGPLYRLPWSVVFNIALAASVLGSAQGFVQRWTSEAAGRVIPPGLCLADDPLTQRRLADATWTLEAAVTVLRTDAIELWEMAEAGHVPSMAERGRFRWNINRGCELVGSAVADLMRAASGRSAFLDHPLQSRFQDIQTGLGHAYLVPDALAKSRGGDLLGAKNPEMVL
ncbi:MAG TPA: acyl-CoA dehydrogenase family protein [Mycobacterium sp.]|nr:acyl-CoA dehydrogenase family protein [Mycobacterium sp.]HWT49528.1 acyl-CoA dehydrogenase family protein [Mycobacterium sp.]